MGKGKGSIIEWCTPIKKGLIFFKLTLKNPILIHTVISYLKSKLPFSIHYSYSNHIIHELNPKLFNFNVKKLPIYQSKLKKK
jgi:ribosomal protein L16/L10AE